MGGADFQLDRIDLEQFGAAQKAAWHAFQCQFRGQGGPFHSFSFALLTARARGDVTCLVIQRAGEIVGFLPVQRSSRFAAMPVGAPINDLNGIIGEPNLPLDPALLCRALKVGRIDFTHTPEDQSVFAAGARGAWRSWYTDLSAGRDAFMVSLKKRRAKFVYHIARQGRQLAREHGEVVFTAGSRERKHLDLLFDWKTARLRSTRQPLVWRAPWLQRLISDSFSTQANDFGGVLFTLTIGDKLVAANYCLRGPRALQGLVMSHDAAFEHYSPGKQLGFKVLEWAAANNFDEMLFGPGDSLFKRQLGTDQRTLSWGYISQPSWSASVRSAEYLAREQIARAPWPWVAHLPARAMRRLDLYRALSVRPTNSSRPAISKALHAPLPANFQ